MITEKDAILYVSRYRGGHTFFYGLRGCQGLTIDANPTLSDQGHLRAKNNSHAMPLQAARVSGELPRISQTE